MNLESGAEDARTPNADAWSADSADAKRLECVRFIGAFCPGKDDPRFSVMATSLRLSSRLIASMSTNQTDITSAADYIDQA
jgi:hypothetical protein